MSLTTPRSVPLSDSARRNVLRRRGLVPPSPAAAEAAGHHRAVDPRFAYAYGGSVGGVAKRTAVSPLPAATKSRTPPRHSLDSVGTAASDSSRLSLLQRRSLEPLTPIALNAETPMAGTAIGKTYVRKSRDSSPLLLTQQPLSTRGMRKKGKHQSAAISSASSVGRIPKSKATASVDRTKHMAALKRMQQRHRRPSDCSSQENDGGASGNGATHTLASLAFSQRSSAETAKTKQRKQASTLPRSHRSFGGGAETSPQKMPLERTENASSSSSVASERKRLAMKRAIIQRNQPARKPTCSPLKHMTSSSSSQSIDAAIKLPSDMSNLTLAPAMRKLVTKYGTTGAPPPQPFTRVAMAPSIERQDSSGSVGSVGSVGSMKPASRPSWVEVKRMSLEKSRSTAAGKTSRSKSPVKATSMEILGRSRSSAVRSSTSKSPMKPPMKMSPPKISPTKMSLTKIPPTVTSPTRTPPAELIQRSRSISRGHGGRSNAYERAETKSVSPIPSAMATPRGGRGRMGGRRAELAERHRMRRGGAPPLSAGRGADLPDAALPPSSSNLRGNHLESLSGFGIRRGGASSSSSLPSMSSTKLSRQGSDGDAGPPRADAGGGNKTHLNQKLLLLDRGRSLVRQKQQHQDAKQTSSTSPLPPRGRKDGIASKQRRQLASTTSPTRAALSLPSHNSGNDSLHRYYLALPKARSAEGARSGEGVDCLGVTQSCSFATSRSGSNGEAGRLDSSSQLRERRRRARQVLARRHGR